MPEPKKKYDLEERSEKFSLRTRDFCLKLKKDVVNIEYIKQLVRASSSIPANDIEANESLGDQDKKMHIKISQKESKESRLWLKHILTYHDVNLERKRLELLQESIELENIFSSIFRKPEAV